MVQVYRNKIALPRQARDKHLEDFCSKKTVVSCGTGHVAMILEDYSTAQEFFLASARPLTALEVRLHQKNDPSNCFSFVLIVPISVPSLSWQKHLLPSNQKDS